MRVVLNMIVKNETAMIRRSLSSLKQWINQQEIVDSGSFDVMRVIARDCMANVFVPRMALCRIENTSTYEANQPKLLERAGQC